MNEGNEFSFHSFSSPPPHPSGVTIYGDILDLLQNDTKYEDIYMAMSEGSNHDDDIALELSCVGDDDT